MTEILEHLNTEFSTTLKEMKDFGNCYTKMVYNHPYRVLASNSYDWQEQPLMDSSSIPFLTDVSYFIKTLRIIKLLT